MIQINRRLKEGQELDQKLFEFSKLEDLQADHKKVNIKIDLESEAVLVETLNNDTNHIGNEIKRWFKEEKEKAEKEIKEIETKRERIKKELEILTKAGM